jgi:integrase
LVDFKFHDLRNTFDSVLAQNGVSTVIIQKLLEHSSSDLTNKLYMNVDPDMNEIANGDSAGWITKI